MPTSPMHGVIKHLRRAALLPDGAGQSDGQLLSWFIERRDEAAFEVLARRHGPMVMSVCRRLLSHHHDAEDAFQATFLVLARKAASIEPPERVANWLHGVAYHTALKAKALRAKRAARERQVLILPDPDPPKQDLWHELLPLLDHEVSRLPEKYRLPIILCDLEGKSVKDAAHHLDWPQGTLAGRLARARTMLAKRLAQHGLVFSAGTLAAVLSERAAPAAVSPLLVSSTAKAATLCAAGKAMVAGLVSVKVASLTEGVVITMLLNKLKTVAWALVVMVLVAGGGGLATYQMAAGQQTKAEEKGDTPANQNARASTDADTVFKDTLVQVQEEPTGSLIFGVAHQRQFVIDIKLAEMQPDGTPRILAAPRISVLENQVATVRIDGSGTPSISWNLNGVSSALRPGIRFEIKVKHIDATKAQISLLGSTWKVEKAEKEDTVFVGNAVRAEKQLSLGKPCRVVLAHDREGEPQLWFELKVREWRGEPPNPAPLNDRDAAPAPVHSEAAPKKHNPENPDGFLPFMP